MTYLIQQWLDESACMANDGMQAHPRYRELLALIALHRDEALRPPCFGDDDCSTEMLSRCAWRNECGETNGDV